MTIGITTKINKKLQPDCHANSTCSNTENFAKHNGDFLLVLREQVLFHAILVDVFFLEAFQSFTGNLQAVGTFDLNIETRNLIYHILQNFTTKAEKLSSLFKATCSRIKPA